MNNIIWMGMYGGCMGDEKGMTHFSRFLAFIYIAWFWFQFRREGKNFCISTYNFGLPKSTARRQQSPTFQFHLTQLGSPMNHNWQVREHFFVALTEFIILLMIIFVEKRAGNREIRLKVCLMKFGNTIYHFSYSLNKTADPTWLTACGRRLLTVGGSI